MIVYGILLVTIKTTDSVMEGPITGSGKDVDRKLPVSNLSRL